MRHLPSKLASIVASGGPYVGDQKPVTRVTVDPTFAIRPSSGKVGTHPANQLPIWWFQRDDNSQFASEIEIPNIKSVTIDRSLKQSAGTLQLEMYNTITPANGHAGSNPDAFGEPGYFSPARGESPDAQGRWGQHPNEWSGLLYPDQLLRCYQGYGGEDLSLADAIDQGYLILNGVFLVDNVVTDAASGILTLNGRCPAKLLIDQYAYPPVCQPPGTMVSVVNPTRRCGTASGYTGGCRCILCKRAQTERHKAWRHGMAHERQDVVYGTSLVPIELVKSGDRVVSANLDTRVLHRRGSLVKQVVTRDYDDDLVVVTLPDGTQSRYTPDHHCVAALGNALKGKRTVYMMRKGNQYRIGQAIGERSNGLFGAARRCLDEVADAIWILAVHDNVEDACVSEHALSWRYGIPEWQFMSTTSSCASPERLSRLWESVGDNAQAAERCLAAFGMSADNPFWTPNSERSQTWKHRPQVLAAANLVDGMLVYLPDKATPHKKTIKSPQPMLTQASAVPIKVHREHFSGSVISLEVEGDQTYVADGILTHNCPASFYGSAGICFYTTGQESVNQAAVPGYGTNAWATTRAAVLDASGVSAGSAGINAPYGPGSAIDGNDATFWLSPAYTTPTDTTYIEFDVQEQVTGVYINPYLPNLTCYVSIKENGVWVKGAGSVGGVPYVQQFGVSSQPHWYLFPLRYTAQTVRFTFSNLQPYQGHYHAAINTIDLGLIATVTQTTKVVLDMSETTTGQGYHIYGSDGGVFDYGDAGFYGSLAGKPLNAGIIGGDSTPTNAGYWMCAADGGVFAFGDAGFFGSAVNITLTEPIVAFRATPSGHGYWLCAADGGVFAYGDANFYGSRGAGYQNAVVDFAPRPQGDGYWMLADDGAVYSFGSAVYHGGGNISSSHGQYSSNPFVAMTSTASGNGYWLVDTAGAVYTLGDAGYYGGANTIPGGLVSPASGIARTQGSNGYRIVAEDGGIFCYGDATFLGSLPGDVAYRPSGNYSDYAQIVSAFLLWAGFWLYPQSNGGQIPDGTAPYVFGNIETTGAYNSVGPLQGDVWDKLQLIDCIKKITDVVGYLFYIDPTGAARFESPNWWTPGNFFDDGTRTSQMPTLDEKTNLLGYQQTISDASLLSEIIVGQADPYLFGGHPNDTALIRFIPPGADKLKGIRRPAMLGVPFNVPVSTTDMEIMAELLAIQAFFALRQGQATARFDPSICIDDQIRIYDRVTGEANIHYVTGIQTTHDVHAGTCTSTISTYWLGDSNNWVVNSGTNSFLQGSSLTETVFDFTGVTLSQTLINFLANTGSKSTQQLIGAATQSAPSLAPSGPGSATVS